jgi:zinc transport system substrate-binding protein
MHDARVLVYNGAGFEPWIQRTLGTLPVGVIRVNATDGIALATVSSGDQRGRSDPHVWADPVLAQRMVDNVLAGLLRADPEGRAVYETNAAGYKGQLAALHDRFVRTLAPCRKKIFVVNHYAFRRHNIRVIYYETLVSPRVANTLARETGTRTLELNPLEGLTDQQLQQGKNYVSVMEDNLRNLVQGLDCP